MILIKVLWKNGVKFIVIIVFLACMYISIFIKSEFNFLALAILSDGGWPLVVIMVGERSIHSFSEPAFPHNLSCCIFEDGRGIFGKKGEN